MIPEKEEVVMLALAEVAKQLREISARMERHERLSADDHDRLDAHALLIEQLRRPSRVPSLRPIWRGEAA